MRAASGAFSTNTSEARQVAIAVTANLSDPTLAAVVDLIASLGVARGVAPHCRLPDFCRRCRVAPSKFAIEIRKVSESHIKRHRADIAIGETWVAQHPVRASEALTEHKR